MEYLLLLSLSMGITLLWFGLIPEKYEDPNCTLEYKNQPKDHE